MRFKIIPSFSITLIFFFSCILISDFILFYFFCRSQEKTKGHLILMFHIAFFPILMENLLGVTIVVVSYLDSVTKVLNVTVSKNAILHSGLGVI